MPASKSPLGTFTRVFSLQNCQQNNTFHFYAFGFFHVFVFHCLLHLYQKHNRKNINWFENSHWEKNTMNIRKNTGEMFSMKPFRIEIFLLTFPINAVSRSQMLHAPFQHLRPAHNFSPFHCQDKEMPSSSRANQNQLAFQVFTGICWFGEIEMCNQNWSVWIKLLCFLSLVS